MAATPSSDPKSKGDDRNVVPTGDGAISFEDKVHVFWKENRQLVLGVCVAVALIIVGKGIWNHLQRQKEQGIEQEYAAATTSEQLRAFAASHEGHTLGAIAELRLADEAYAAGKSADAIAGYGKVIAELEEGPLAARARLGQALAKLQAGQTAEGAADLRTVAGDAGELKAVRVEAMYHLASLASANGDAAEVQKLSEQLMQLDPSSPWVQRTMMLRASLPAPAAPAAEAATPAPPGDASQDQGPKIDLKLPGK